MENEEIVLTPEQEIAFLKKKFNVDDVGKIGVKETEPSAEEIQRREQETETAVLTTGIQRGWFKKEKYDEYQQIKAEDHTILARRKFAADHPELGNDVDSVFDQVTGANEPDEIEETPEEGESAIVKPNLKKKAGQAIIKNLATSFLNDNYGDVLGARQKYETETQTANRQKKIIEVVNSAFTAAPTTIDIQVGQTEKEEGGEKVVTPIIFKYPIDPADVEEAKQYFLSDPAVLNRQEAPAAEEVTANAMLYIQTKNISKLLLEYAATEVAMAEDRIRRGNKGLLQTDIDTGQGGIKDAKIAWLKSKGIKVPGA